MKIEINRPHPDYPLAYVHVPINVNLDGEGLSDILAANNLTILGRWEYSNNGFKAPVLLEDEHVKPKKKPAIRSKK